MGEPLGLINNLDTKDARDLIIETTSTEISIWDARYEVQITFNAELQRLPKPIGRSPVLGKWRRKRMEE